VQDIDMENVENYDSDEFEGLELLKQKKEKQLPSEQATSTPNTRKGPIARKLMPKKEAIEYWPEVLGVVVVLIYFINYIIGSSKNRALAEAWLEACMEKLESNFTIIGIENKCKLERDSASLYTLYCSGRINCESVTFSISLKPRHDLFMWLYGMVQALHFEDVVSIQVAMGLESETGARMEKFCFAVVNKSQELKVRSDHKDLSSPIVARRWKTRLHDVFSCISDDDEIPKDFMPDVISSTLNEHRQYVKLLHFTEAMVFGESWNPLRHEGPGMRFQFVILPSDKKNAKDGGGEKSEEEKLAVGEMLLVIALRYIDKVVLHKLSGACRDRLKKVQSTKEELEFKKKQVVRDRAAQDRKVGKIQKEKAALASRSPEELAKYEEKMRKKQSKGGVKMKMK